VVVARGHLGGYIEGGDPATAYPELWTWLVEGPLAVSSVVDVGCGDGVALRYFAELGCSVLGVEGVPQDDERIVEHDYTTGPYRPDASYDLAWSCEFVEHVEARYVPNFLATFKAADLLLMTHAEPGQAGYHHVNCRSADYWIGVLAGVGFQVDPDLTADTRRLARLNLDPWNHYARSGLAFRR
jgi:SAM-dependent methyltransferase